MMSQDPPAAADSSRVEAAGKFFRLANRKWHINGLTYGPFAPNADGEPFPSRHRAAADFAIMQPLGANCIRIYHIPPVWLMDLAIAHGIRVFIDIPWDRHRCFFEDFSAINDARLRIRSATQLLGNHPATFAISVANEIPKDIVRYSGHRHVSRFIGQLIDIVKHESPRCLATYCNYPSTEFLEVPGADFTCFNVYLNDPQKLGDYLHRLQHIAGDRPLVLGEFGLSGGADIPVCHAGADGGAGIPVCPAGADGGADIPVCHAGANGGTDIPVCRARTFLSGQPNQNVDPQSEFLSQVIQYSYRQGLAGSFIFSFTDDWHTGGAEIEDWSFGIRARDRAPKPAAAAVSGAWQRRGARENESLPKATVAVCAYNGARTLTECLLSLTRLNYPDLELILIDDGSADDTPQIASQFPGILYVRQENRGLSAARNVAARAATGQVIAYTDADCIVDEDWLLNLVRAMQDQELDAVGGPNIPPPHDGRVAQCVAASPGAPTHVMVNDRLAEHIPGCNMAFRREMFLELGGFDPIFRQAGDDVDICWRLLEAGKKIGYAPGAMVWHHRRATIRAYLRQQAGYGRAEALLHTKYPHRFNALGAARWHGIIYGATPGGRGPIHFGRFGLGLFQMIYRRNEHSFWNWPLMLEWHFVAAFLLSLAIIARPIALASFAMWLASIFAAGRAAWLAPLPRFSPRWRRAIVFMLNLAQPIARSADRYINRLLRKRLPRLGNLLPGTAARGQGEGLRESDASLAAQVRRISWRRWDMYWSSAQSRGREQLLPALQDQAARAGFEASFESAWTAWDASIGGGPWHDVRLYTATENLGSGRAFTRVRSELRISALAITALSAAFIWTATAAATRNWWALGASATLLAALGCHVALTTRRVRQAISRLLARAAHAAKLDPVRPTDPRATAAELSATPQEDALAGV